MDTNLNIAITHIVDRLINLFQPLTDYVYFSIYLIPTDYVSTHISFNRPTKHRTIAKIPVPAVCNEFIIPLITDVKLGKGTLYTIQEFFLTFSTHTTPSRMRVETILAHPFISPHIIQPS